MKPIKSLTTRRMQCNLFYEQKSYGNVIYEIFLAKFECKYNGKTTSGSS